MSQEIKSSDQGAREKIIYVIEPEPLMMTLIEHWLEERFRGEVQVLTRKDFALKLAEYDAVGKADLVILPVRHHERGSSFAESLVAVYPDIVIMFFSGGAMIPRMCSERREKTFFLGRPTSLDTFERTVRAALKKSED